MNPTPTREPLRIFTVGLSDGLARSLARYLADDPCIALTGVAPGLAACVKLLPLALPDVILISWAAINFAAPEVVCALRTGHPGLRIVCLVDERRAYAIAAAQSGADVVIENDELIGELESVLHSLFPGRVQARNGDHRA